MFCRLPWLDGDHRGIRPGLQKLGSLVARFVVTIQMTNAVVATVFVVFQMKGAVTTTPVVFQENFAAMMTTAVVQMVLVAAVEALVVDVSFHCTWFHCDMRADQCFLSLSTYC